jgi:short-subunit dehydrogenase
MGKLKLRSNLLLAAAGAGAGLTAMRLLRRSKAEDLRGQVVLITGGSRGLGLALAEEFAAKGSDIAICARDDNELERARKIIARTGARVFAAACDVSERESVHELVQRVRSRYSRIDILVNNAGEILVAPLENTTLEDMERAMAVMFWGAVYPTLEVLPEMEARHGGHIAVITSIGGKVSVPHLLAYSCAKFAAVGFSEGLRAETAQAGVKVTTIVPGLMRTGSHLKAKFKGRQEGEAAWFSVAATSPAISIGARRAARQIVTAIARGESEKILSTPATILAYLKGVLPGLVPDFLSVVNRMLPGANGDRESVRRGEDLEGRGKKWLHAVTALGRRAARDLNQLHRSTA